MINTKGNWFFTADPHLEHSNIIKYCNRPFMNEVEKGLADMINKGLIPSNELRISRASTSLMTDTIIQNTNAVVGQDDVLVIVGDFCWTSRDNRFNDAKKLRDRINCRNVILIVGNHDDRRILSPLFSAVYDQYTFNVDGQSIFANHYPSRAWDKAHHGCWNLYGHVHGLYTPEDNGKLMPYEEKVFKEGFESVLKSYDIYHSSVVDQLLAIIASTKGVDLTLDVGVDNNVRGDVPFGTPWSMDEIRDYMNKKKNRWMARKEAFRLLSEKSTSKD